MWHLGNGTRSRSFSFGIGVLLGCFGRKIDGPGLPGGLIIYQGHLFPLKGHQLFIWPNDRPQVDSASPGLTDALTNSRRMYAEHRGCGG